ncbi:MAG: V-type ATPase subunit [Candidatus Methanomethylicaceae archaeon]
MAEISYSVVKASARKGQLLSDQQIMDLASSKDLKEFITKLKDRYPSLLTLGAKPTLENIDKALFEAFCEEVQEFIGVFPKAEKILGLLKQDLEEGKVAQELSEVLRERKGKEKEYEELVAKLHRIGFDEEVKEGERIFEKYGIPGLIASAFARRRLLKLTVLLKKYKADVSEVLAEYLKLKIDEFNLTTLMRGIKNGIRRDALEELFISDGKRFKEKLLREAVKAPDLGKAISVLGYGHLQEDPRSLERELEKEIRGILTKAYYGGYTDLAAVIGYLELKKLEVLNLIRVANCIERGIAPKDVSAEFLF